MERQDIKNLKKRYLVWFYKQTKDALDRVERKFTQLDIDRLILEQLRKLDSKGKVKAFIDEFKVYMQNKQKEALVLKYDGNAMRSEYYFLELKLLAIEKAIVKELGRPALKEIKQLYEQEMLNRILQERQQKV